MDVGNAVISLGDIFFTVITCALVLWLAVFASKRIVNAKKVKALANSSFKLNHQEVSAQDFELLSTHNLSVHSDGCTELRMRVFLYNPNAGQVIVLHQASGPDGNSEINVSVFDAAWFRNNHLNGLTPGYREAAERIEKRRKKQAEIDAQSVAW